MPPLTAVPSCLRLAPTFDPERLVDDLERVPGDQWVSHFNQEDYVGDWRVTALKSPTGSADFILPMQAPCGRLRPTAVARACPYLTEIVGSFNCPLRAARLMWLGAGAEIKSHADHDLNFAGGVVRIHLPLRTHELVKCFVDGRRLRMQVGECWYADFSRPHAVINGSAIDRVHLVLDCEVNPWLAGLFERSLGLGT